MGLIPEYRSREPDPGAIIVQHICHAIYPFKPGGVTFWTRGDFIHKEVVVEAEAFPGYEARISEKELDNILRQGDVGFMATEIGLRVAKEFADIYTTPEEHIELGEN